jgi:hypothetical protein
MVAEANKNPTAEAAPEVKVGDGGKPPKTHRSLPKPPRLSGKTKLIAYVIAAIVIIGGGWLIAKQVFHVGEKVYAEAAGHKIYKDEIDHLVGTIQGVSDRDAAKVLADKYLYEAIAKKAGIKVTDQEVSAQYPDANKKKNPYAYQGDLNNVYYDNLIAYNKGLYKGEVLVTNFSRYIAFQSPYIGIQQATSPKIGNKAAAAADKKYAFNLINKLYKGIKSGQITFDEAVQIEHKDPQVGDKAYQTLPHSGPFDTSNIFLPGTDLLEPVSIQPKLAKMKAGELSKPFAVRVPNSWYNKKITTESYYLVVRMDSTKGSHSGLPFKQYLAKAKKQYGYKINI